MTSRIAIGSDHAGFTLKGLIKGRLLALGHSVQDLGTHSSDSIDYPVPAHAVAGMVERGEAECGILICGSGNGVSIAANKHVGIRSALAWNPEIAALGKQHNNANVLAIPARFVSVEEAFAIVDAYLGARFEGGRHQIRVDKIEGA